MMNPSPIVYPGGKTRAVPQITGYFPIGIYDVVAPFAGGCSMEIVLANRGVRVHASDLFEPLVNFWDHALTRPGDVASIVRRYHPIDRDTFYSLKECYSDFNDLERAAAFFVVNRASYSGIGFRGGYKQNANVKTFTAPIIDRFAEFVCPGLSVDLKDYKDALAKHPDAMAWLDPPYMIDDPNLYGRNGELHNKFDHDELAEVLRERKGWVMTYNDCEKVRKMYDYARIDVISRYAFMSDNHDYSELVIECE